MHCFELYLQPNVKANFFVEFYEHTCHVRSMNRTAWRLKKVNKFDTNFQKKKNRMYWEKLDTNVVLMFFFAVKISFPYSLEKMMFLYSAKRKLARNRKADNLSIISLHNSLSRYSLHNSLAS